LTSLEELGILLPLFDVPKLRRDITYQPNVKWLLNNITIQNGGNAKLGRVMILLKSIYNDRPPLIVDLILKGLEDDDIPA
jgi:hypothetical protein